MPPKTVRVQIDENTTLIGRGGPGSVLDLPYNLAQDLINKGRASVVETSNARTTVSASEQTEVQSEATGTEASPGAIPDPPSPYARKADIVAYINEHRPDIELTLTDDGEDVEETIAEMMELLGVAV